MEKGQLSIGNTFLTGRRLSGLVLLLSMLVLTAALWPALRILTLLTALALFLLATLIYLTGRRLPTTPDPDRKLDCGYGTYEIGIPLKQSFRFAHEPLDSSSNGRFVGRKAELEALVLRILFSEGGSFLVTGYRGVGKTSYVNQVVRTLKELIPWAEQIFGSSIEIVDVHFNLARPLKSAELMHHIIRRLVEELRHKGIYSRLAPSLREELNLAYDRTSFNMSRKLNEETEKSLGMDEASIGSSLIGGALKGSMHYKQVRSEGSEYSYLGYDDKAAEHDVIRLSRELSGKRMRPLTLRQRFLGRQAQPETVKLVLLFVFDELDKLEEFTITRNGRTTTVIDELLSVLKNVFTTSGISFVFVAGKDTQERWLEDLGRGDSVYESVFAYERYLPCLWGNVRELCDSFVDWQHLPVPEKFCAACQTHSPADAYECRGCGNPFTITFGVPQDQQAKQPCVHCSRTPEREMFCSECDLYTRDATEARAVFSDFKKYLNYRGRGIPRRIIRGFNEYVFWGGKRPILVFTRQNVRHIRLYAELEDLLAKNEELLLGKLNEEISGTQRDKQRLAVYYLVDWILRQGSNEFTAKQAVAASRGLSAKIAPAEEIALSVVSRIIEVLSKGEFLELVEQRRDQVQIGDIAPQNDPRYRVVARRLIEMRGEVEAFHAESDMLRKVAPAAPERIAHYQLQRKLGSGGMGTVYKAWDEQASRIVAIKILLSSLANDPQAIERFKRESEIMNRLRHPNLVRCFDSGSADGRAYIAMEFIDGLSLELLLSNHGKLDLGTAVAILKPLLEALQYVHSQGIVRNDIKPGNILISNQGTVYLMDLGIAKQVSVTEEQTITSAGVLVGTPYYMSPEQHTSNKVDQRSDIYSFGVVFYEMLTGHKVFDGKTMFETIAMHIREAPAPPSSFVALPQSIEDLILRCLRKAPGERFQTAAEIIAALAQDTQDLPRVDLASLLESATRTAKQEDVFRSVSTKEFPQPLAAKPMEPPVPAKPMEPAKPLASPIFFNPAPLPFPAKPADSSSADPIVWPPPPPTPPPTPREDSRPPQPVPQNPTTGPLPIWVPPAPEFHTDEEQSEVATAFVKVYSPVATAQRQFALSNQRTDIGRSPDNQIMLDDPQISRYHATIEFLDGAYSFRDLNTSNGSFLNEVRVTTPVSLTNGDRIQLGEHLLVFENII